MTIENDFLPFAAASTANVLTQTQYAALSNLITGFISGKVSSAAINKILRQTTLMSSILGQFIANTSGQPVVDDGTTATILANLTNTVALQAQIKNTKPLFAANGTTGTSISATTTTLVAPSNGIAVLTSTTYNANGNAYISASLGAVSGALYTNYGGQGGVIYAYLPMTVGQSSTFTATATATGSVNLMIGLMAFFLPFAS